MKFTGFDFTENILKGLKKVNYIDCTPVQEKTFLHSLKGRDIYVQSQTGTGKTAAFLLTIFNNFESKKINFNNKALIVAPTRELAVQIEKEAKLLSSFLNLRIGCFYGGVGYKNQEDLLDKGVDIIIGTPGRLLDFQNKRKIDLKEIGYFVIDEADRLFDMGFFPDIRKMMRKMVPYFKRQTMLFSATLNINVKQMAWEYMNSPESIEISPEKITVENIDQKIFHVGKKEKINLLLGILNSELPRNALIFTNTKHVAVKVSKYLSHNGKKCQYLIGDLPQNKRLAIINDFKSGRTNLLVATDVAARGLHVDDLELVVNYDLPGDSENYVHRIGRTARAGKSGKAVALACEDYIYNLDAIEKFIDHKIPVGFADDDLYEKIGNIPKIDNYRGKNLKKPSGSGRKKNIKNIKGKAVHSKSMEDRAKSEEKRKGKYKKSPEKPKKQIPQRPAKSKIEARKKPVNKMNEEERMEYYKKKYGDDFKITEEKGKKKRDRSFFKKVSSIFKKKN
ncbi:MAG: DEAD/DEAH box helicase [Acidobacteriota bacterium]